MATPPFRRPLQEMLEWSSQDVLEQPGQVSGTFWSQGKRKSAKSAKTAQMSKRTEKTYRVHLAAVGPYLLAFAFFCRSLLLFASVHFFLQFFPSNCSQKGSRSSKWLHNDSNMVARWVLGSLWDFPKSPWGSILHIFFFVTFRSATLGPQSESGVITKHFLGRKLFALRATH